MPNLFTRPAALLAILGTLAMVAPSSARAGVTRDDALTSLTAVFQGAKLPGEPRLGLLVVNARTGEHLVSINPDTPMKPASCTKLATAAASLERLGPDRRFTTTIETDGEIDADGVLKGTLLVRGGGDPSLGPRFQVDKDDVTFILRKWAEDLKALGIRKIDGDVIGDDSLFAGPRWGTGWYPDERGEWYMAEISALTFNDGCIDVHVDGSSETEKKAKIRLAPDTKYAQFVNEMRIVPSGATGIALERDDTSNLHTVRGSVNKGASLTRWTAVADPARYVAWLLREELEKQKIAIVGHVRSTSSLGEGKGPAPEKFRALVKHPSAPLSEIMTPILANSQNLYTECVGRVAAIDAGYPATFEGTAQFVTDWVEKNGLQRTGFVVLDGSGLSSFNRIPPRFFVDLLRRMNKPDTIGTVFRDAMARPGERGTLKSRLAGLEGRLSAKTGSLGDTSTLAGYLKLRNGEELIVVVMIDGTPETRPTVDALVREIDMLMPELVVTPPSGARQATGS